MRKLYRGILYLSAIALGLFLMLAVMVFATIDPYSDEDMSRGGICERSGGVAPECAMASEDPNKVLDALLACDTGFFNVLAEERAAFGRTEIHPLAYNMLDSEEPRATSVRFREPVEAYGLHLTGYLQRMDPSNLSWGFHATEKPADVARVIEARHPEKGKFSQHGDSWRREVSAANAPRQWIVISPPNGAVPGTSFYCHLARGTGAMEELPEGFDLFLSQGLATNFVRRFDAFAANVEKTISDVAR